MFNVERSLGSNKPQRPLFMLMDGHAMVHRAWHGIQNPLTLRNSDQDVRAL